MSDLKTISISITEAAKISGLSKWTLYKYSAEGKIPIYKIGNRSLIPIDDFREWLDQHRRSNKS